MFGVPACNNPVQQKKHFAIYLLYIKFNLEKCRKHNSLSGLMCVFFRILDEFTKAIFTTEKAACHSQQEIIHGLREKYFMCARKRKCAVTKIETEFYISPSTLLIFYC